MKGKIVTMTRRKLRKKWVAATKIVVAASVVATSSICPVMSSLNSRGQGSFGAEQIWVDHAGWC